jgi:hypothetical protein
MARRALGLTLRFHDDADMSARGAAMLALSLDGTSVVEASRRLGAPSRLVPVEAEGVEAARLLLEDYQRASHYSVEWRHRSQ